MALQPEEEENFCYAMQIAFSSVLSMSMQSAIELGVFDIIAKAGPGAKLSSSEIVAHIGSGTRNSEAPMMLDRILRLLASHSILICSFVANEEDGSDSQRLYSLGPVSNYFVTNEDGVSLGPLMAFIQDKILLDNWPKLKEAVTEGGIPFNRVHGIHSFEYLDLDPRFNQVFSTGMFNHTTIVMKKIVHLYKGFEKLTQLVDVGSNVGVNLSVITSKYPHIKGINFDLPHVVKHAPSYPRVEHVGGDMFASVPSGDAIFMKWILHDWNDQDCIKLLKNCYNAIPDDGKVIIVEALLPVMPETSTAVKITSQIDVLMLTLNWGGKERSREEFMALATGDGFSGIKYECFVCNCWVMEIFK
ncbi:caffeic acid 3-O-methyltransferase 1-like [Pyrus ussuriensis x Pyrus communis]|uniref:caffeate O-methyltransferase n=1 Tax=Pyrus ussuriensis x Pyrus communis TaxID=2448454 RepID=A0A5N5HW76_9ROSA|nr:caffeic acid 3-O-methyltransferase 1-like [Pyrus ussuriensis x Pyrus communis]